MERKLIDREENERIFKKIKYDFYFFYSLRLGYIKLSPDCVAFLSSPHCELFVLEDREKCKQIFKEFLEFVKTSPRFVREFPGVKTGIEVKVKWSKKIKYWFKKKPSEVYAVPYFQELLKKIGFLNKDAI